jgi:hypothetical protein
MLWTPDQGVDTIVRGPLATKPAREDMEIVNLRALGMIQGVAGGAPRQGTHVAADIVTRTADGRDLNEIWTDFMALLNAVNSERTALINFLTFGVTQPVEQVAQAGDGVDFEIASEFGQPVGQRIQPTYFNLGYGFRWYDLAARYTWQYLADATAAMVDSVANAAVEAYYRLLMTQVLRRVFNSTTLSATINQNAYSVYGFYNADGTIPPTYKTNTFNGTHTHYKVSGAATVTPDDLDQLIIDDFTSHGYSMENGYRLVLMVSTSVANTIRTFRANVATARYDFIPAVGQPGQIMTVGQEVVGQARVPNTLAGLNVVGNYGPLIVVADDWMPATHMFSFATGGENALGNPVGLRQHANTALRGLRLVQGRTLNYPLIDSYWAVGFGTGVRQRGGGIVIELTADPTYDPPAAYV